jgi:hypothetical protein
LASILSELDTPAKMAHVPGKEKNNNIRQHFELRIKTTEGEQEVEGVLKDTEFIRG